MTLTMAPSSNVALSATSSPLTPTRLICFSNGMASPFSPTVYTSKKSITFVSYMLVFEDVSTWGLSPSPRAASETLGITFSISISPLRTRWCLIKLWVHPHFPAPHCNARDMQGIQERLQCTGHRQVWVQREDCFYWS